MHQFISRYRYALLGVLLLCMLAAHWRNLQQPPYTNHLWRQSVTAAVSRNFFEQDMNILHPRVDRTLGGNGITGMGFPFFEWIGAVVSKAAGHHAYQQLRWQAFGWYCASILLAFWFVGTVQNDPVAGVFAAVALATMPEVYYWGSAALPDVVSLPAMLAALGGYVHWHHTRQHKWLWLMAIAGSIAAMVKLQFLVFLAPVWAHWAYLAWRSRRASTTLSSSGFWPLAAASALPVLLAAAWYVYAIWLQHTSRLMDIGVPIPPMSDFGGVMKLLDRFAFRFFPQNYFNHGVYFLILGGIVLWFWKYRRRPAFVAGLAFGLVLGVYHIRLADHLQHHIYYMFIYLPLLIVLAGSMAAWCTRIPWLGWLPVALLVWGMGWHTWPLVNGYFWGSPASDARYPALADEASRLRLAAALPDTALVITGDDVSGCVILYALHKKGYSVGYPDWLADTTGCLSQGYEHVLDKLTAKGVRWYYNTNPALYNMPNLDRYLKRVVLDVNGIQLLELQPRPRP